MFRDGSLTVRPVRPRDARTLHALLMSNREWLRNWEATYPSQTASIAPALADVKASIKSLLNQARAGLALPFVLVLNGEVVGQLNVASIQRGSVSSAGIGYWIAESAAGQGAMTRAVALVTDFCMVNYGLHRVEICIRPENHKSMRVVEKLGFRFEGLRRRFIHINGAWADHFCWALVREDVPEGVFTRYSLGLVPVDVSQPPAELRAQYQRG